MLAFAAAAPARNAVNSSARRWLIRSNDKTATCCISYSNDCDSHHPPSEALPLLGKTNVNSDTRGNSAILSPFPRPITPKGRGYSLDVVPHRRRTTRQGTGAFVVDHSSRSFGTSRVLLESSASETGGIVGDRFGFTSATGTESFETSPGVGVPPPAASATLEDALSNIDATSTSTATAEAVSAQTDGATAMEALPFEPYWLNPSDQVINAVLKLHELTGLPYIWTVTGMTIAIRLALVPVFIKGQRNTSRMAHMKPEMDALKARFDAAGPNMDMETQQKLAKHMNALFEKYDCHPGKAMMLPFIQMPIFMSMFFGLRKMPEYFPTELAKGGAFWFPDLGVTDPYYILPVVSAGTFLLIIEIGKDAMLANPGGSTFLNFFRVMGVAIAPITAFFPAVLFCYWVPNNLISLAQSAVFKNKAVKKMLGIWEPPKPVPGAPKPKGMMDQLREAVAATQNKAKQQQQQHNQGIGLTPDAIAERNARIDRKNNEKLVLKDTKKKASGRTRRSRRVNRRDK